MKTKGSYSTSEVMAKFQVGRNTLRLYEEMDLLPAPVRTESGYRRYGESDLEILKFALDAKNVGFSLNEIKKILELSRSEQKLTCAAVSNEVNEKLSEIDAQISSLQKKKTFLKEFHSVCSSNSPAGTCDPISAGFNKKACC